MTGSSPQASKKAVQSRRPRSKKRWRPAASESTPSMSKTTAGPDRRAAPSSGRHVQLVRSPPGRVPGMKVQPNGAVSPFWWSASSYVRKGKDPWRWHHGRGMRSDVDRGVVTPHPGVDVRDATTIAVALGRRVEVVGDLLLPQTPTDSSRAACRDIARRLEDWQGPGIVVLCGRLLAPGALHTSEALQTHAELTDALGAFAARPDSQVVAIVPAADRDPDLIRALEACGVRVHDAVDLTCETGAGTRTVLVRAGSLWPDANPPIDSAPSEDRPWLVGMERLEDPRLARRFVTSRLLYRRLRRFLWAPPLVLAAIALLLRVDFVVDGLGRVFRSPRQQDALQRAYAATWFSPLIATVVIAVALLAVLAVVVAITSRGIWRALGGDGLPLPWAHQHAGADPVAHAQLEIDGMDALDAARRAMQAGASAVI